MATTAASGAGALLAALGLGWACAAAPPPRPAPLAPRTEPSRAAARLPDAEPEIGVGLVTGAVVVRLEATGAAWVAGPDGGLVRRVEPGERLDAGAEGEGVRLRGVRALVGERFELVPEPPALLRVDGRAYRGRVVLLRDRGGLTVVNRLPLEDYLRGVLPLEMGRRAADELEALAAQAVAARTYALRNRGRWRAEGFDLRATVADQAYGGAEVETPLADSAVARTRGEVLTFAGELIDAWFHSTCGGRTEAGPVVFARADGRYLRTVRDVDGAGRAWCAASPRFRWRESWAADELRAMLASTLPPLTGVRAAEARGVRDVRVLGRTGSGRADSVEFDLGRRRVRLSGPRLREALRIDGGGLLRSANVTFRVERDGGGLARLVAEGQGWGHGVGMCQWGAIGRALAGHDHRRILAAYYHGVAVDRRY